MKSFNDSQREVIMLNFDKLFDSFDHLTGNPFQFTEMTKETLEHTGSENLRKPSYPKLDVIYNSSKKEVRVVLDVLGWNREDITITFRNNVLDVYGKSVVVDLPKDEVYLLHELKKSAFRRSLSLKGSYNEDAVKATFSNGSLVITIPCKSETSEGKPIKID